MRRIAWLFPLVALTTACISDDDKCFPLAVGNEWTYDVTVTDYDPDTTVLTGGEVWAITGTDTLVNGTEVFIMAMVRMFDNVQGPDTHVVYLNETEDYIVRYIALTDTVPFDTILAFPLELGKTWGGYEVTSQVDVTVPAGTFSDCWEVSDTASGTSWSWYWKSGVGPVMMTGESDGGSMLMELTYFTNSNEPEPFYEGTPEDDAQIDSILTNAYPELLNTIDGFISTKIAIQLPGVTIADADRVFRVDSPLVKQQIDSSALAFIDTNRFYDRWYSKDTACTVYLIDTFYISSLVHIDSMIIGHYDSLYIGPTGDTNWVLRTIDIIHPTGDSANGADTLVYGDGRRLIFLEPLRSTEPTVDPFTGDTTYAIIEPFEWQLKRISYGSYYCPTRGTDAPTVNRVILTAGTLVDTIVSSSTDTLYTGHAMNRLRSIDSLLQYTGVDSIQITIEVDDPEVAGNCTYFAVCAGTTPMRKQLAAVTTGGRGYITLSGEGIVNLYFEAVLKNSYYYINPHFQYTATVWLVPVVIN